MDLHRVAVATVTWARSPDDEALLVRALTALSDVGLPVAVGDKGNSPEFAAALGALPNVRVGAPRDASGLVGQVRASLGIAETLGRPFVLYVEPDKEWFFTRALPAFVAQAPEHANLGAAIAARSAAALSTFPPMQQYTEGVLNRLCGELIGEAGDFSYGPFLLNRALLPALAAMPDDLGWGWRPFAFAMASRRGYRVLHVEGDYPCPEDQRQEDENERRHRMRQLSENIRGLLAA